jgi:hypothetical protein
MEPRKSRLIDFLVWLSLLGIFLALELPRIDKAGPDELSDYIVHGVAFVAVGCAAMIWPIGWMLRWLLHR